MTLNVPEALPKRFFEERNQATRIDMFDELSDLTRADLRGFFRKMGATHLFEEVVVPLLREGDSQVFVAVRDRPWPPWGLGARNVSAACQIHLVGDQTYGISPVYVGDEDLTNVGLVAAVYKELLEYLVASSERAEVNYLVADGSTLADHVLQSHGFQSTQDVFITEGARYFTYTIRAEDLLKQLRLDTIETPDLLLHDVPAETLERNALFHSTIFNGHRSEWSLEFSRLPSELIRLVRGGHFSKPGGVPTGTGRFGRRPPEETDWSPYGRLGPRVLVPMSNFLSEKERAGLLEFVTSKEADFKPATVMFGGAEPQVDENVRKAKTLDGLEHFEQLFGDKIKEALPQVLERLGHEPFPVGRIEIQATASGDRDYFRIHQDAEPGDTREISFAYFLHREPKRFSGGDLRVFETRVEDGQPIPSDQVETVVPRQNEIVFFPSIHEHEVLPVRAGGKEFADSRFAINGWIHRAE
jgi:2OG-Fe(II) oxygenase superfamily